MVKKLRDIFNVGNDYFSANAKRLEESTPIVVNLSASGGPYSNVKIFNSLKNINLENYGLPLDGGGITANSGNSVVDYGQMLQMLNSGSTYKIKKISVITDNPTLLRGSLKINRYDALGDDIGKTITLYMNTFQAVNNQIDIPVNFKLDRNIEIVIGLFPRKANVQYRFYPESGFDNNMQGDIKYSIPENGDIIISKKPVYEVKLNSKNIL